LAISFAKPVWLSIGNANISNHTDADADADADIDT
jgi:hypothetical protein